MGYEKGRSSHAGRHENIPVKTVISDNSHPGASTNPLQIAIATDLWYNGSDGAKFDEVKEMASSKSYLEFILDQLSSLDGISYKAMMGEYIIYYRGKIVGGIYDDRFLVKPTESAKQLMPYASYEIPYEGAKKMLLVDDVDNREFLNQLLNAMVTELPEPRKKA